LKKKINTETLNFRFNRKYYLNNLYRIEHRLGKIKYSNSYEKNKQGEIILYSNKSKLETFINEVLVKHCSFEVDLIARLYGFFKSLENRILNSTLNSEHFDFYLDGKLSVPFLMKKIYNSPSYYLSLNCINKKILQSFKNESLLSDEEKESINSISCFKKRKINTPQTSFLIGYIYGLKFLNGDLDISEIFALLKDPYRDLYKNHKTIDIRNKCDVE
jgi:hypothetical protein